MDLLFDNGILDHPAGCFLMRLTWKGERVDDEPHAIRVCRR
jgi:hypothetical protein